MAYCLVLRPVFEVGLAPGVEGHGELLHLLTVDLDLQFLVVTPDNPDLTKPDRASRMYWIENWKLKYKPQFNGRTGRKIKSCYIWGLIIT